MRRCSTASAIPARSSGIAAADPAAIDNSTVDEYERELRRDQPVDHAVTPARRREQETVDLSLEHDVAMALFLVRIVVRIGQDERVPR